MKLSEIILLSLKNKNMLWPAWRAVLSEAVVTRDTVPGLDAWGELSVRQYLAIYLVWYEVLPSRQLFSIDIPRASPSVTTALPPYGQWVQGQISLSIAIIRTLPIICGAHQFHSFLSAVCGKKGQVSRLIVTYSLLFSITNLLTVNFLIKRNLNLYLNRCAKLFI